uniref:Tc1-like transposase DDE domain-containing protein n=1 Tax=Magnetospirillum gryphiswaldense TaxID=55518 RepID=A4U1Q8_9PROT|nr:hypothetical protein MGR_3034 [Magnetospirillum gryphiswaldense MSR-1]
MRRRRAWFELQPDLDPERLVFIDETGASTKMARLRGRAPRGERCRAPVPHGHWKTTTFVGALRLEGMTAPMVLDGAMNGPAFRPYVRNGAWCNPFGAVRCPGHGQICPAHKARGPGGRLQPRPQEATSPALFSPPKSSPGITAPRANGTLLQ